MERSTCKDITMEKAFSTHAIIVTGANSGIGAACARHFVGRGVPVIGTYRNEAKMKELLATLGTERLVAVPMDVADERSRRQAAERIPQVLKERGWQLYAVVNNAGIAVPGPMKYLPMTQLKEQFEVNVFGLVDFTQRMLPLLRPAGHLRPRVLLMSSVAGLVAHPMLGAYSASKYAVEAIGDAWRIELKPFGIELILIEPGPIRTPIWKSFEKYIDQYRDTEYAPFLEKTDRVVQKMVREALPVERVAKVVYKACTQPKPKTRYLVARGAWMYRLMRILPDRWKDSLFLKYAR